MTQDPYLPDGCTHAAIDRAMGAMDPALEQQIDEAVAQLQAVRKILTALHADAETYREAFRKLSDRYDDATRELSKLFDGPKPVRSFLQETVGALENNPYDFGPAFVADQALSALPSDEELEEQMKRDWEEDHGR